MSWVDFVVEMKLITPSLCLRRIQELRMESISNGHRPLILIHEGPADSGILFLGPINGSVSSDAPVCICRGRGMASRPSLESFTPQMSYADYEWTYSDAMEAT